MSGPNPQLGIMDIAAYVAGESAIENAGPVIKLSSNEGAFGPSPVASAAYAEISQQLHRYPDSGCTELRRAIAEVHGLDANRIVCGAGSDEIISMLCSAYAGPGDEILYSEHGFLMYPISARAAGATPVAAPETELTADIDSLLAALTDRTRIVFLANPNNPTGTFVSGAELARLHAGLPETVLLVIDAAYAEYVSAEGYSDGLELVEQHDNVVMTRTFSKIHGLGGMRLGWGYCPVAVADVLNRVRGPFNVSAAAQAAGVAAIGDREFTRKVRQHNDRWLAWTRDRLRDLGLSVPDGVGNFLLACFPEDGEHTAADADAFLKRDSIIVRRMDAYGLPRCLRITIGLEDEMRAVVDSLSRFMGHNA